MKDHKKPRTRTDSLGIQPNQNIYMYSLFNDTVGSFDYTESYLYIQMTSEQWIGKDV
jgi:hypothetical protein